MWPVEKWELLLPFVYAIINKDPTATTFVFETLWTELEAQIEKWRYSCKQIRRKINENFVTLREHRDFVLPRAKPFEDAETLEHVAAICCQYRRDNKKAARPHWNATNINQRLKRQDFSVDAFKKRLRDSVALQEAQHLGNKEALRIMAAVGKRRRSLETARLVLLQPNAPDASRSLTAEAAPMPQALVRAVAAAASPVTKKGNVARPILWLGMSNKLLRKFEFVSSLPAQEEEIDDKLLALRRSRAGDLRKNLQAFAMRHSPNSPAIKGLYRVISEVCYIFLRILISMCCLFAA